MKTRNIFKIIALFLLLQSQSFSQFWEYQVSGTTQHLNGVYILNDQTGWVCGDGGTLLKTTNGGQNWGQVNVTANNLNAVVFLDNNTGIAVGDNGTIIRTTNGGTNWSAVSSGTGEQFRKVSTGSGGLVFASGDNGLIAVSNNDGATWQLKNSGTTARFRSIDGFGTSKIWAAGDDGLIRYSSDGGNSWTTQITGITNDDIHDIQLITENIGFAGGSSSNFIFTSDGGQTWTSRNSGIFMGLNGIYFKDVNIGWGVSDVGTIFFTTDGGISWTSQPCGSPFTLKEAYFLHQGKGWTVGESGTIVMYNNPTVPVELNSFTASVNGNNVQLKWITSTEANNRGFEIERKIISPRSTGENPDYVRIGYVKGNGTTTKSSSYSFSDRELATGVYSYRIKQIDFDGTFEYMELSGNVEIGLPASFKLSQNYPNPFNPSTRISYELPVSGNLTLKVYDILGNEVATLANGFKEAGNHNIEFNASELSSGIYYYQLKAAEQRTENKQSFIQTKKMILIK
jgi:photosystem II stability/assembly factor-like uncharacterized protein